MDQKHHQILGQVTGSKTSQTNQLKLTYSVEARGESALSSELRRDLKPGLLMSLFFSLDGRSFYTDGV